MRESSIAKHLACGPDSPLARAIGEELRRRRVSAGLRQEQVGHPLTKAFVSAVEHGHVIPSLPALILLSSAVGTDAADILETVKHHSTSVYNRAHGDTHETDPSQGGGGRSAPG